MAEADVRAVSGFCPDGTEETASVAPFQTRVTNLIDNVGNWHVCHMFFFVHFSHRLTDPDAALCHQRARLLLWSTLNAEHCVREDRDLMHVSCLCDCCSNTRELKGGEAARRLQSAASQTSLEEILASSAHPTCFPRCENWKKKNALSGPKASQSAL